MDTQQLLYIATACEASDSVERLSIHPPWPATLASTLSSNIHAGSFRDVEIEEFYRSVTLYYFDVEVSFTCDGRQ